MDNSDSKLRGILVFTLVVELAVIVGLGLSGLGGNVGLALVIYLISTTAVMIVVMKNQQDRKQRIVDINKVIGKDAHDAFNYGKVGILTYSTKYVITWMSDFFDQRDIHFIGDRVTQWLPETNKLFQGDTDKITVNYKDHYYEVIRHSDSQMLFFLDITDQHILQTKYDDEAVVLGLIHLDNYEEATQYEEETTVSLIDSKIKQPVIEWAMNHGMMIKRLRNNRFMIILNEKIYHKIVEEHFSILDDIRKASSSYTVPITLSMAIARGTINYQQLDEMLNSSLELAQSRGGDQVAVKEYGNDVKYFGGNSEAQEKRSKVRVRVISQSLRELIQKSQNVIIVGHHQADFDCMGSAIGVSCIANSYHKPVSIVCDPEDVEKQCALAMAKYNDQLMERHNFITEEQALRILEKKTLVVMVDHHNLVQCNAPQLVQEAKRIVVIDHHRRTGDFAFNPLMVYLEASASSVCELVTELFAYQLTPIDLSEEEATLMYTGISVDTMNFKMRTGSRTFEAAAQLKKFGADPLECAELLKEDFASFELRTNILKNCEQFDNGIVVAAYNGEEVLTRAVLSQVANEILSIKGVEAAFVLGAIADDVVGMSARSIGNVNVQVILEKMHGGGHFTQAGLQRNGTTVEELKLELLDVVNSYFASKEDKHESNTTE